jgi:hypothetical protein
VVERQKLVSLLSEGKRRCAGWQRKKKKKKRRKKRNEKKI